MASSLGKCPTADQWPGPAIDTGQFLRLSFEPVSSKTFITFITGMDW